MQKIPVFEKAPISEYFLAVYPTPQYFVKGTMRKLLKSRRFRLKKIRFEHLEWIKMIRNQISIFIAKKDLSCSKELRNKVTKIIEIKQSRKKVSPVLPPSSKRFEILSVENTHLTS